jgi:hypothetical protein
MSLQAYLEQYKCENPAIDGTTTPIGGGIDEEAPVTGTTLNEVLFRQSAQPAGGSVREQRAKWFVKNSHPTEDLQEGKIYLANGLDDWAINNTTFGVQSTSVSDTGLKVRAIGNDTNGDPIQLETNVNGTTLVASADTLTALHSAELRDQATGVLQPGAGGIRISRGGSLVLGEIPPGHYSATNEFKIWLPASLNDTGTATDTFTNPSGASWSRPRTVETALAIANSGTLTAEAAQAIWLLWSLQPGTRPRFDLQCVIGVYGSDFEG